MEKRNLLYFNPGHAPADLSDIGSAGWEVYTESDLRKVRDLITETKILVGLAHLEACDICHIIIQPELLFPPDSTIEWVALLPPASVCGRPSDICTLILRYFFDYHTLPPDRQRLLATLGHAYGIAQKLQMLKTLEAASIGPSKLIGTSPAMQQIVRDIQKVACVDAPVLITGESGTGKELAAQAIHGQSRRSSGAFVPVNCSALPASLIQSELFGHEKGAFTGAIHRRIGAFESAAGGTIFLDEIGDLPFDLQANLLRFLQEKKIHRIGGHGEIPVDVRIVAATNVNLEKAVQERRFREDLYYRLNVLHIHMPALRERKGDIELLARYFFDLFSREKGHSVKGFTHEALLVINSYSWPGNVREMINRIRRAEIMCEKRLIAAADLGLERRHSKWRSLQPHMTTLGEARSEAEKDLVLSTLRHARNNISLAARELRVSRITLYRLIDKYGISAPAAG